MSPASSADGEQPAGALVPVALGVLNRVAHPESAGCHIVTAVPIARDDERVEAVIARLAREPFEALEAIYVVDRNDRYIGAVRLPALPRAPRDQRSSCRWSCT